MGQRTSQRTEVKVTLAGGSAVMSAVVELVAIQVVNQETRVGPPGSPHPLAAVVEVVLAVREGEVAATGQEAGSNRTAVHY